MDTMAQSEAWTDDEIIISFAKQKDITFTNLVELLHQWQYFDET
jgi:hypothetical protein